MATKNYKTHPREYASWSHMKARCLNPNEPRYKDYGGRGISVCERWLSFANFIEDMGDCPRGFTIDRIDNSRGYEPSNCRWTSYRQQNNNTRRNAVFSLNGMGKTLSQWISHFGLKSSTVRQRLYVYGWSLEKSLFYDRRRSNWQQ